MNSPSRSQYRFRWLLPIALGVVLVAGMAVLSRGEPSTTSPGPAATAPASLAATSSSPQAKITWSQPGLDLTLSPGESASRDLSFSSNLDLSNVVLEAVPEIAGFVILQPSTFPMVSAGQLQAVHFSFAVPAGTTLGTYDATVHARVGSQTLPQTLKVNLNIWQSYENAELGFTLRIPPAFVPKQSMDSIVKQAVFLLPPGTSENDVIAVIEISALTEGSSLLQAIGAGGIEPGAISQVNIAGRSWFSWFSPGQGDGTWSYATLYSPSQAISVSTPSAAFASSSAFLDMLASLTFQSQ